MRRRREWKQGWETGQPCSISNAGSYSYGCCFRIKSPLRRSLAKIKSPCT
jgi:hypothetical protein